MSELTPGIYTVGIPLSSSFSQEQRRAINHFPHRFWTQLEYWLSIDCTIRDQCAWLNSVHYGRGKDGKRDSSVCCSSDGNAECYGVIQKLCLCPSTSASALVQPFQVSPTPLLKSIGNPCGDVLQGYADIDLLSAFFYICYILLVCAVPVSQILL